MPKVALTAEQRRERKLLDFKIWVRGKMALTHKTQADVGEALGVSQGMISKMLKIPDKRNKYENINPDPFTYGQALILCDFFGADEDERRKLLTL